MDTPSSTDDPTVKEERRRRLKAARAYAGLTVKQLAARISEQGHARGYSSENINLMERRGDGGRAIHTRDIRVFAEACGLPPAFFTVDFGTLDEPSPQLTAIDDRLERLTSELRTEQLERGNLESALLEVLGEDLQRALGGGGQQ